MKSVQKRTFQHAVATLSKAFAANPSVLQVIKRDHQQQRRIAELCHFCVSVAIQKEGAYISSNNKGVALLFKSWLKQKRISWLLGYLRLGQRCIGWTRAIPMIQRDKEVMKRRFKPDHLYFWMLGIDEDSGGLQTIIEIRDFAFNQSRQLQLPICAETSMKKTLSMYQRYGFKVYDEWDTGKDGVIIYFIRREWDTK